jgi:hypothetical protein
VLCDRVHVLCGRLFREVPACSGCSFLIYILEALACFLPEANRW